MRVRAQSFSDHYSQATLFWNSMSETEREHIVGAFAFELGKCVSDEIRERTLANLANVDSDLTGGVAAALGKAAPKGKPAKAIEPSPALSMELVTPSPIAGRVVGVLAGDGVDVTGVESVSRALESAGALVVTIAAHGGEIEGQTGTLEVTKTFLTTQSVEYDALVVAGGPSAVVLAGDPYIAVHLGEAFRHHKPIAAWGEGVAVLEACGIALDAPGVVTATKAARGFSADFIEAVGWHRHWARRIGG